MIFQILPKLSVARDLPQTYRQTVPPTSPSTAKLLSPNLFWVCAGLEISVCSSYDVGHPGWHILTQTDTHTDNLWLLIHYKLS